MILSYLYHIFILRLQADYYVGAGVLARIENYIAKSLHC